MEDGEKGRKASQALGYMWKPLRSRLFSMFAKREESRTFYDCQFLADNGSSRPQSIFRAAAIALGRAVDGRSLQRGTSASKTRQLLASNPVNTNSPNRYRERSDLESVAERSVLPVVRAGLSLKYCPFRGKFRDEKGGQKESGLFAFRQSQQTVAETKISSMKAVIC